MEVGLAANMEAVLLTSLTGIGVSGVKPPPWQRKREQKVVKLLHAAKRG